MKQSVYHTMNPRKAQESLLDEIIVDNFAGGGGASTGIELATGRTVAIAINHDPDAILMHRTNHPYTEHLQASVWDVDPVKVCRGRPVGLAWFSPDCKHFSKAKGAALVDRNIRGLAWIVLRWAGTVRPRVIILENVEEFQTWGPVRRGKPVKSKAGQTFQRWKHQLTDLGYQIEHRELVAADYGAPTTRKRFVLIARCDGQPIVWPERTHAPRDSEEVRSGKLLPWRSAAEIIDWSLPCLSIFASKQEIKKQFGLSAVRPLAENTMRRVIRGVDKFTIKSSEPFIVQCNHAGGDRAQSAAEPMPAISSHHGFGVVNPMMAPITITNTGSSVGGGADQPVHTVRTGGGGQTLVTPNLVQCKFDNKPENIKDPLRTVTSVNAHMLATPYIVPTGYGERPRQQPRVQDINDPLNTVVGASKHMVATPNLMCIGQTGGGDRIRDVREPAPTTVSKQEACIVAPTLIQYHTEQTENVRAAGLDKPINTVDASNRYGLTCANLVEYYGNGNPLEVREPMHTVTSHDREALTLAHVVKFKGTNLGQPAAEPMQTETAGGGQFAVCKAHLCKIRTEDRFGHWPEIRGLLNQYCGYHLAADEILLLEIGMQLYYIADIGLRMLTPRELYNAMGFPVDYIIDRDYLGHAYGKSKQVARCGNAVCPPMAEAVVRANLPEWCKKKITTMADLMESVAV